MVGARHHQYLGSLWLDATLAKFLKVEFSVFLRQEEPLILRCEQDVVEVPFDARVACRLGHGSVVRVMPTGIGSGMTRSARVRRGVGALVDLDGHRFC